jgi:hypothetical protein
MANHDKDHVTAILKVEVRNSDGTLVRTFEKESDSFLENFLLLLRAGMRGSAVSIRDTEDILRSCLGFSGVVSGYDVRTANIVVGSDNGPVSPADYKLGNQITELQYVPLLIDQPTVPVTNGSYIESKICDRTFNNNTLGTIDVNEVGICVIASTFSILILRDVLDSTVRVLPNQTMQVTYLFRTAI